MRREGGGAAAPTDAVGERPGAAWIPAVAEELAARAAAGALPPISSLLVSRARQHAEAPAGGQERVPTASALAAAFRELAPHLGAMLRGSARALGGKVSAPRRVLSLCTGYDAALELASLGEAFGALERYVSVDLDAEAVALNRRLFAEVPRAQLAEAHAIRGDVRSTPWMSNLWAGQGPFDLCLVVHPPVAATAYGVPNGAWLKPDADRPVMMDLLYMKALAVLSCPVVVILVSGFEFSLLRAMCGALGLRPRIHERPPLVTLGRASSGAAPSYADLGRYTMVLDA
ncbi:MAG: hypothetical protein R3A79_08535 [Nannocystaceae bacterium]